MGFFASAAVGNWFCLFAAFIVLHGTLGMQPNGVDFDFSREWNVNAFPITSRTKWQVARAFCAFLWHMQPCSEGLHQF